MKGRTPDKRVVLDISCRISFFFFFCGYCFQTADKTGVLDIQDKIFLSVGIAAFVLEIMMHGHFDGWMSYEHRSRLGALSSLLEGRVGK